MSIQKYARVQTKWGFGVIVDIDIDGWISVKYVDKFDIQTYSPSEFENILIMMD